MHCRQYEKQNYKLAKLCYCQALENPEVDLNKMTIKQSEDGASEKKEHRRGGKEEEKKEEGERKE